MADISDKITNTRNAGRPNTASVSSVRAAGGTTLACDDLTGWPTASKVHFVTYQVDTNSNPLPATQLDCSGIVSGNNINSFSVIDGTDNGNSVGDVVEMLPTAAWGQDLAEALTTEHNRTGTHSDITADSVATDTISEGTPANGVAIDGLTLKDGLVVGGSAKGVDNTSLNTDAGKLGAAWAAWTPTLSGRFVDGDWTKNCKFIQIGKTVICKFSIVASVATPMAGGSANALFTLPVTARALDASGGVQTIGMFNLFDATGQLYLAHVVIQDTTTARIRYQTTGVIANIVTQVDIDGSSPFTWAVPDEISGTIIYEAA